MINFGSSSQLCKYYENFDVAIFLDVGVNTKLYTIVVRTEL